MSFRNVPVVKCDWPGCRLDTEAFTYIGRNAAEMRKTLAARFGWTQIKTMDFCDHHPVADHVPAVEHVKDVPDTLPGWRSTCSCGWVEEPRRYEGWDRLHLSTAAKYAWSYWERHLPREDQEDCKTAMEAGRDKRWGWE